MKDDLVLYDSRGSPCARRVRIVLLEKGLPWTTRLIDGHGYLVGDRFTIADLSVLPRVAMYPLVRVPLDGDRHPNVARWLGAVGRRPSIVQREDVRPAGSV